MHCVREDGVRRQQACRIIDVRIGLGGRKKLCNEGDFVDVFGDVGLDWHGRGCGGGEGAELAEGGVCAGWGEAGGYDGPDEGGGWVEGMDVSDCGFCGGEGGGRGFITVVGWAESWVIHADTADEGALAFCVTDCCKEVRGGDVDCCIVGGAGSAVREGTGYNVIVDCVG